MPTKKTNRTRKPTAKAKASTPPSAPQTAAPTKRRSTRARQENPAQLDLFAPTPAPQPKLVGIRVPMGIPITFGFPEEPTAAPAAAPASRKQMLKEFLALPREKMREALLEADITSTQVTQLSTTVHSFLYRFAAIGGKVTRRGARD